MFFYKNVLVLDTRQRIVLNASVLMLSLIPAIAQCIWVYSSNFYFGFVVMFMDGFLVAGLAPIVCEVLIIVLKTETYQAKLIGMVQATSTLFASVFVLLIGLMWSLDDDLIIYFLGANALVIVTLGLLLLIRAINIKKGSNEAMQC
eukprot:151072_1